MRRQADDSIPKDATSRQVLLLCNAITPEGGRSVPAGAILVEVAHRPEKTLKKVRVFHDITQCVKKFLTSITRRVILRTG